jgi:hypothetical protein
MEAVCPSLEIVSLTVGWGATVSFAIAVSEEDARRGTVAFGSDSADDWPGILVDDPPSVLISDEDATSRRGLDTRPG